MFPWVNTFKINNHACGYVPHMSSPKYVNNVQNTLFVKLHLKNNDIRSKLSMLECHVIYINIIVATIESFFFY